MGSVTFIILCLPGCKCEKMPESESEQNITVKVQKVGFSKNDRQYYYVGFIEKSISVPVSFLTMGQAKKVYVTEGQKMVSKAAIQNNTLTAQVVVPSKVIQTDKNTEENLRINNNNYKGGIVNISDMLEAQAMLQQAKDQLADALANYKIKLVSYMQVTGRY